MRRNLLEDVDVRGNYGKIWARRYAGGGGKWEDLRESEKFRRQSQLREQAIAAAMPEDMSAMSPPPTVSAVSAGATAGLKAGKYTFPGDSRADMDEARRLADMRIAKSHMEQIEAQRQRKIEKQQKDMLEAAKKEIAQRRVDRAERQFQIAKDMYNKGGDVQELSDRIRLDLLRELSDSFWDETPSAQANANADSGVWGYSPDDLERMKRQEQARRWTEQYNDVAGKMQTSFADAPKFTADQINAASAGLRQGYEPVGASPFTAGQINEASEGLQRDAEQESAFWRYFGNDLAQMKQQEQAKKWAEQYNDVAGKMQTSVADTPKFTSDQINAAAAGLRQGYEPVEASPFTAGQINTASTGLQSDMGDETTFWGYSANDLDRMKQWEEIKKRAEKINKTSEGLQSDVDQDPIFWGYSKKDFDQMKLGSNVSRKMSSEDPYDQLTIDLILGNSDKNRDHLVYSDKTGEVALKHGGFEYEIYAPDNSGLGEAGSDYWTTEDTVTLQNFDFNLLKFITDPNIEFEDVEKEPIYFGDVQVADESGSQGAAAISIFTGILNTFKRHGDTKYVNLTYQTNGTERRVIITVGSTQTKNTFDDYADNVPRSIYVQNAGDPFVQGLRSAQAAKLYKNLTGIETSPIDIYDIVVTVDKNHKDSADKSYLWIRKDGTVMEKPIIYPKDSVRLGKRNFLYFGFDPLYNLDITESKPVATGYQKFFKLLFGGVQ